MAIRQDIADKFNITLSETFLNHETSHNLEIPGFHPIFRRDRGSFGGGVACYVGSNLVTKRRGDLRVHRYGMPVARSQVKQQQILTMHML